MTPRLILILVALWLSTLPLLGAQLKKNTLRAWDEYVKLTEERIAKELETEDRFLVTDFLSGEDVQPCRELVQTGGICVLNMRDRGSNEEFEVPNGRIHHWLGKTLIPGARLDEVVAWIQDYDHHDEYYDDVEESRLLTRKENFFQIFLRLKRKKVITVHYNTTHDVNYFPLGSEKLYSSSISTRIREIDDPGSAEEKEKPEGRDNGFLWRLNSYWRYQQTADGVLVECESLSLSRDVPALLFMIEGIVDSTAREALQYTLGNLRDGFRQDSTQVRLPPDRRANAEFRSTRDDRRETSN
jgi:hypothetical protein